MENLHTGQKLVPGKYYSGNSTCVELCDVGPFDTKEQAVAHAMSELDHGEPIVIGVAAWVNLAKPSCYDIFHGIDDRMKGQSPLGVYHSTPQSDDLQQMLEACFTEWRQRWGIPSTAVVLKEVARFWNHKEAR